MNLRFGFDFPPFGEMADPIAVAELAATAEAAGWDGVFLWDHITYREPVTDAGDPWIALAAIAMATERVKIGSMVTPLPRRRPQIVARQAVGLDQLSRGRFILGAGLGLDRSGRELSAFGEELDDRTRGAMLDESLAVIDGLWSGERFTHRGEHYLVDDVTFLPEPVQQPRLPIWLAGRWPHRRPLRRAARWDGLFLIDQAEPGELAAAVDFISTERGDIAGFDIVTHQPVDADPGPWAAAGATWLMTKTPYDVAARDLLAIARAGPARPD